MAWAEYAAIVIPAFLLFFLLLLVARVLRARSAQILNLLRDALYRLLAGWRRHVDGATNDKNPSTNYGDASRLLAPRIDKG
jgi:hypothetical protein